MKKTVLIFFIIFSIFNDKGYSQVAKFYNEFIGTEHVVLIGPLNVDTYYYNQADKYISEYNKLAEKLNSHLETLELELELDNLEETEVKISSKIEEFDLAIELVENFIFSWQEHQNNLKRFHYEFNESFNSQNCYDFVLNNDTIRNDEVEISKLSPKKIYTYYEFINGDFSQPTFEVTEEDIENAMNSKSSEIKPRNLTILKSDIFESIENCRRFTNFFDGKLQEIILDVEDQKVIERVEGMFPKFSFDSNGPEFFREVDIETTELFYEIRLKDSNKQIIPDNWFKINCN